MKHIIEAAVGRLKETAVTHIFNINDSNGKVLMKLPDRYAGLLFSPDRKATPQKPLVIENKELVFPNGSKKDLIKLLRENKVPEDEIKKWQHYTVKL